MRDGLLGLGEARGDGLAHAVVWNDVVAALRIKGHDLGLAEAGGDGLTGPRRGDWRRRRGLERGLARLGRFDICPHNTAMRTGAADDREIDAGFLGKAPGKRRSEDAGAVDGGGLGRRGRGQQRRRAGRHGGSGGWRNGFGRLSLRRGCGYQCRSLGRGCGSAFPFSEQNRDNRVDLDVLGTFRNDDLADLAFVDSFHFHGRLVGFDLGNDVAGGDGVAFLDVPFGELALFHGGRERRHGDVDAHLWPLTRRYLRSTDADCSG